MLSCNHYRYHLESRLHLLKLALLFFTIKYYFTVLNVDHDVHSTAELNSKTYHVLKKSPCVLSHNRQRLGLINTAVNIWMYMFLYFLSILYILYVLYIFTCIIYTLYSDFVSTLFLLIWFIHGPFCLSLMLCSSPV